MLHDVPGVSDSFVPRGVVLMQCFLHVLGEDDVHITPEHVGSNATSHLAHKDEPKEHCKLSETLVSNVRAMI